jgi:hypothetical protein
MVFGDAGRVLGRNPVHPYGPDALDDVGDPREGRQHRRRARARARLSPGWFALMALIVLPAASRHPRELPYVRRRTRGPRLRELSRDAADGQRHAGSRQRRRWPALHYKNKWIAKDQCYHCHSDYGLGEGLGGQADRVSGILARYTTRTYQEPIQARVKFDNNNCLTCHEGSAQMDAVRSHVESHKDLGRESGDGVSTAMAMRTRRRRSEPQVRATTPD